MDERAGGAMPSMVGVPFMGTLGAGWRGRLVPELIGFCQFVAELFIYPDEMLTIDN